MTFPGGSAWSLARDIAEGVQLVTERTFKSLSRADLDQLTFEIDRALRDLRSVAVPLEDITAIQQKNRKLQRLNGSIILLRAFRQRHKT